MNVDADAAGCRGPCNATDRSASGGDDGGDGDGLMSGLTEPATTTAAPAAASNAFEVDRRHSDDVFMIDDRGERGACTEERHHHHSLPTPEDLAAAAAAAEGGGASASAMETIAGVAGNVLEWYDFAIFGYFGDIIGDVFFPPQAGHAAIVESFAVFGGAFMMRPIGGVMMGYIGDRFGRKRALEMSIFLMAFPTFLMGCLPSYERIGPAAVALLAVIRCLQGLSVGGQLMSSLVFTLEKHPKARWGLYGSYVMAAANVGTLLGGIVGFVMRATLSMEQLRAWGWRVPFLSGILVSFCGLYLKLKCNESELGHNSGNPDGTPPNPIKAAFSRGNRRSLLSATLVPMMYSGGFYLTFVWLAIFMSDMEVPPVPHAFAINSASLFASIILAFPFSGILSDIYGRRRIMFIGGACVGILSPLMISVIGTGNPVAAFFAQSTIGISLTLWGAPMMAWLVESFPPAARLTSVAIGYNIAQAIAGGLTPAVATVLVDKCGPRSPGFILSVLSAFSMTGLLSAPYRADANHESTSSTSVRHHPLDEERVTLSNGREDSCCGPTTGMQIT